MGIVEVLSLLGINDARDMIDLGERIAALFGDRRRITVEMINDAQAGLPDALRPVTTTEEE